MSDVPVSFVGEPISNPDLVEELRNMRRRQRESLKYQRNKFQTIKKNFEDQESVLIADIQGLEDALDLLSKPNLTPDEIKIVFKTFYKHINQLYL